jgi:amidase
LLPGEYARLDAVALRALIVARQVTAAEVERAARLAVADVDPDLAALARPLFDEALWSDPAGELAGVPFLIKDSGPFARGVGFAIGSRAVRGAVADHDHPLMTRFRTAGLSTIGQTTAPEFALSFATESTLYGATRNPWAPDRGAGGSSGGAAALVAAGAVPLAHANDGAGSIRIPAAACGLVGLRMLHGRSPPA